MSKKQVRLGKQWQYSLTRQILLMIAGDCYAGDLTLGTLRTLNHSLLTAALAGSCHFVNDETEKRETNGISSECA